MVRAEAASAGGLPTREAILDAAERLFSAHGLAGVAMRDLARELGLRPSSLYNHFQSKQALYDAVLERGLGPIGELLGEAWRTDPIRQAHVHATVGRLVAHLAAHPHLAQLLQRALLEDTGAVRALSERWVDRLYHGGLAVVRSTAAEAGWRREELPHLALALFGLVFGYFINAPGLRRLLDARGNPFTARALGVQRAFLEKAIRRLLTPRRRRPRA